VELIKHFSVWILVVINIGVVIYAFRPIKD